MTFRSLILLVFFLVATPVWARDIYVNNVTGEDRNDGSASEVLGADVGPVRTITRALQLARKADRVIVSNTGEAYHESITLQGGRQSGVPDAPFELVGNGAMLDGTAQVPTEGWSHYQGKVFRYRPPKMSFQLLYLDAKPAERRKVAQRGDCWPTAAAMVHFRGLPVFLRGRGPFAPVIQGCLHRSAGWNHAL